MRSSATRATRGFTLVELVLVIVLTGVIAAITGVFIVEPVRAYVDQARRARLTDAADIALRRMGRDIRAAVPNSVRVHPSGLAIEMLNGVSGARYREAPPPGDPDARLEFDRADDAFNVTGSFPGLSVPFASSAHYLVIYNLGTAGSDAYAGSDVITPAGTSIGITAGGGGEQNVTLDPPFQFRWESPQQRVVLSDGAIRYTCDPVSGTLRRDTGGFGAAIPYAPAAGALVTERVAGCAFAYTPGTATRSGVATLRLTVAEAGEQVRLLRQVHVENLP